MKATKHERYRLSFEPDEAMHFATLVAKVARPSPGFVKGPTFTAEEKEVLDTIDGIFNPPQDDEG